MLRRTIALKPHPEEYHQESLRFAARNRASL
jgi:hypothetical protein